jgi:hypothetical protein
VLAQVRTAQQAGLASLQELRTIHLAPCSSVACCGEAARPCRWS